MTKKSARSTSQRLLLTDRSLEDISVIEQYSINQWGKRTASKNIAEIENALTLIQSNPKLLRQEKGFHSFLKFYNINKHLLVFDTQARDIILLTVFHGSIDISSRLAELEPTLATEAELLHRKLHKK